MKKHIRQFTRQSVGPRDAVATNVLPRAWRMITKTEESGPTSRRKKTTYLKERYFKFGVGLSTKLLIN